MAAAMASASQGVLACRSELTVRPTCRTHEAPAASAALSARKYATAFTSCTVAGCSRSSFSGASGHLLQAVRAVASAPTSKYRPVVVMEGAAIQFIRGLDEISVPDVRLTRSVDGNNGTATFVFDNPSVFDSSRELGDITGIYLVDDEGIIQSVDVSAKFVNGKPAKIEARHIMRTPRDWDRFMRFMERYAEKNNLGFVKK